VGAVAGLAGVAYMVRNFKNRDKNMKLSVYVIHTRMLAQMTVIGMGEAVLRIQTIFVRLRPVKSVRSGSLPYLIVSHLFFLHKENCARILLMKLESMNMPVIVFLLLILLMAITGNLKVIKNNVKQMLWTL
jgi:hypothetical protein